MKNRRKCFSHSRYACLKVSARRALRFFLDSLILPKHRAIEIQMSDAEPARLDLQARLHYASADSRVVNIAEKVMRYLNEHAGAGHTVPIILTLLVSPGESMAMNKIEKKDPIAKNEKQEDNECNCILVQQKPCGHPKHSEIHKQGSSSLQNNNIIAFT